MAVLSSAQLPGQQVKVDAASVLEPLLVHQQYYYWRERAEAAGLLSGPSGLSMAELSRVIAAGFLLGTTSAAELDKRVPGVTVTERVARWLRDLYPPDPDGGPGALRPDRLAELCVSRELGASPELAEACLTGLDADQARHALILLARASAEHDSARSLLESSVERFADVITPGIAPLEVMIAVADAMPYPSLALAEAHASITKQILAFYPPGAESRAPWLNNLSALLDGYGRAGGSAGRCRGSRHYPPGPGWGAARCVPP